MTRGFLGGAATSLARAAFAAALAAAAAGDLPAQAAWTLEGRVTDTASAPIPGAQVEMRGESAEQRARADAEGRFRLPVPAAERTVVLSVHAPGFLPTTRTVRLPAGAAGAVTVDVALPPRVVALEPVHVRARRLSVAEAADQVPGTRREIAVGLGLLDQTVDGDFVSDQARRFVGVAEVPGAGLSIAGQSPDQTRYTTDGVEGGAPLPREGTRSAVVLVNTYDVARGGFTGGQVDVRTQTATNGWGGSVRGDAAHPWLRYGADAPGSARAGEAFRLDAGGGGAIAPDRLLVFGAVQAQRSEPALLTLDGLRGAELAGLGVHPDSVARLLEVSRGEAPGGPLRGAAASSTLLAMTRLDAILSPRHLLSLRVNGGETTVPDAGSITALAGTGFELRSGSFGALASLASGGRAVANDLRLSFTHADFRTDPRDPVPLGTVTVESRSEEGIDGVATLRFAGSGFPPGRTRERGVQLADEVIFLPPGSRHRLRAGVDLHLRDHRRDGAVDPGHFHFHTLADLEAGRPASFTRAAPEPGSAMESLRTAFYVDDRWEGTRNLQVEYGIRVERTEHRVPDSSVEELFPGARPGTIPAPWLVSPRVGFAFSARLPWNREGARLTHFHGGFGDFVGALPATPLSAALHQQGGGAGARLTCLGDAVPVPDWNGYRGGASIPDACADGAEAFAGGLPDLTFFSPDFVPARVRRASLGSQGIAGRDVFYGLSVAVAHGRQPAAFDRNLRAEPAFVLGSEGGRAVFAPAGALIPESGTAAPAASRAVAGFGTVREVTAEGRSRSAQATASLGRFFLTRGRFRSMGSVTVQAGYTWTRAEETVGGIPAPGRFSTTTGADPRRLEWAPAGHAPRHAVFLSAGSAPLGGVALSVLARVQSGSRYTPLVVGDVNADGFAGDRAFVFDPAAPEVDGALAGELDRLMDGLPAGARDCLRRQAGRIAGHNSCASPAFAEVDVTARWAVGPRLPGSTRRRVNVWLSARNVTAGLDHLLHGSAGARGWGQRGAVDPHLLFVRGFDAESRTFRYAVNSAFGRRSATSASRTPFQLRLQARVTLGEEPVLRRFQDARSAGSNRRQAFAPENVRLHAERQLPNLPAEALSLNGPRSLGLTPAQALRLEAAADSLAAPLGALLDEVVTAVGEPDGAPRPLDAALLGGLAARGDALRAAGLRVLRETLAAGQLARLPAELRREDLRFAPRPAERVHLSVGDL